MAVSADFGINASKFDDSGIKSLLDHLTKIIEYAVKIESAFASTTTKISTAASKMSQSFVDADGKIAQSGNQRVASAISADEHLMQVSAANNAKRVELAKKETKDIEHELQGLKTEKQNIESAITATEDKELKKRFAAQKKEVSEEIKFYNDEQKNRKASAPKESHGEGGGIGIGGIVGIGAAVEGFKLISEATAEASAAQSRLQAATGLTGKALDEASEAAEELGHTYKIGGEAGKEAMAAVGSFTHATGDKLKEQTEDAIILAQKMGTSTEAAAKLLGKAGDPEVAGNLKKLGINLDANATTEERAAAIHIAAMNAKAGVDAANDTANKNSQEVMMELREQTAAYAGVVMNLLNPALKIALPILPELVIGIAAVTIAMNAQAIVAKAQAVWSGILTVWSAARTAATFVLAGAQMALNAAMALGLLPVLAIVAGIALLVAGVYELIKHFKEVAAWVANAGGAILSMLGIVGKAEAATSKHTKALDANKLALEEQARKLKESQEAAERNVTALESLQKANDDLSSSAKKNTDLAVTQIEFLQKRLTDPTLTGKKREMMQKSLDDTIAYSKKNVAVYEGEEAAHHAAAIAGGAAVDNDAKKVKDKSAKIDKDAYTAAKNAEDIRFDQDRLDLRRQLASKQLTHEQFDAALEAAETIHVTNLDTIASQHRKGHEKDAIAAEDALLELQIKSNDKQLAEEKKQQEKLAAAKEKADKLDEKRYKILLEMQDEADKSKLASIKDENEKQTAEENARYAEELDKRADDLGDLKIGKALAEALETNHQNKLTAIAKVAQDKRDAGLRAEAQLIAGPIANAFAKGFQTMMKGADDWTAHLVNSNNVAQNILGSLLQGFTQMIEGLIVKFLEYEAAFTILNIITGGGAAALMGAFDVLGALGIPGHADGTDNSPGGWHWTGERGPELVNMRPHAAVIPNHKLSNHAAPIDWSPVIARLDALHSATVRNGNNASKQRTVLTVGDSFRGQFLKSEKAEARRSA